MKETDQIPIFFIIGRPRTGTTLLLKMFDAHPNVIIPWECQFIVNLYPKYGRIKRWSEEKLLDFYQDLLGTWQFKFWNIKHEKLKKDLLSVNRSISYADLCKKVHLTYQSLYPKEKIEMIGDKNPGYSIYIDKLKKIYPEARFIFINRDYRDNYYSICKVDFELPIVSLVVYKWKHFFKKALQAREKYPGSVYLLNYEDLAAHPREKFAEVCSFLGLDFREDALHFHNKREESMRQLKTERSRRHHQSLFKPVNTGRIGLWERELSEQETCKADYVAGKYARLAGYKRKYHRAPLSIRLQAFPGILYAKVIYGITSIVDTLPYKTRALILNKGPLFLVRIFARLKKAPKTPNPPRKP